MTRTEAVLRAIEAELERRREVIDTDDGLLNVAVIVKMERPSAMPGAVIWRTESLRSVRKNGHRLTEDSNRS